MIRYTAKALTKFHWFLLGVNFSMGLLLTVRTVARHPRAWG